MSLARGKFKLYPYATPLLRPGGYPVAARQAVVDDGTTRMEAQPASWTLQVTAPRLRLPPEEVLGVFPAASAREANTQQLPHVTLRSRTLPWARLIRDETGDPSKPMLPWMALLVFERSEAQLVTNKTLGDFCGVKASDSEAAARATIEASFPGISGELSTKAPANLRNEPLAWAEVPRSVVQAVMPGRDDELRYLAHVREVNTEDDEGKGDDDGFTATILANRLIAKKDTDWVACLVNLEAFGKSHEVWKRPAAGPLLDLGFLEQVLTIEKLIQGVMRVGGAQAVAALDIPKEAVVSPARGVGRAQPTAGVGVVGTPIARFAGTPHAIPGGTVIDRTKIPPIFFEPRIKLPLLHHWEFHTAQEDVDFETLVKRIGARQPDATKTPVQRVGVGLLGADVQDLPGGQLLVRHVSREGADAPSFFRGPAVHLELAEIGRASCRERVS
jgi:hypothetical protein